MLLDRLAVFLQRSVTSSVKAVIKVIKIYFYTDSLMCMDKSVRSSGFRFLFVKNFPTLLNNRSVGSSETKGRGKPSPSKFCCETPSCKDAWRNKCV